MSVHTVCLGPVRSARIRLRPLGDGLVSWAMESDTSGGRPPGGGESSIPLHSDTNTSQHTHPGSVVTGRGSTISALYNYCIIRFLYLCGTSTHRTSHPVRFLIEFLMLIHRTQAHPTPHITQLGSSVSVSQSQSESVRVTAVSRVTSHLTSVHG